MKYTFGDTPTADDRLKRISTFFNPLAEKFIRTNLNRYVSEAIDLGCGPGHTTHMLAKATGAGTVTGFDISKSFIESARKYYPDYSFVQQDIVSNKILFNADIIYVRFLLSHVQNTKEAIKNWISVLNPGGLLFIDELENVVTNNKLFNKYLKTNDNLIKSHGANLYIGRQLEIDTKCMNVVLNESAILPVENKTAAWWFYPNTVSVWKTSEVVKKLISEKERNNISRQMFELSESNESKSNITWIMKRIIIQK